MSYDLSYVNEAAVAHEIPEVVVETSGEFRGVTSYKPGRDSSDGTVSFEDLDGDFEAPPRIKLTWNNLIVEAEPPANMLGYATGERKRIIHGVTGYAEPGSCLAIMGSSGAGKSTLLNVLTWRNLESLVVKGDILSNGVALGTDITSVSAYVQQDDLFFGELTVKEHLIFSARLRMDASISDRVRSKRVQEVMGQMGLKKCEHTHIGHHGMSKTISGGEKKRLSFAAELLNQPSILFCDEPTSGLDSYLAKVVVECMQNVAKQGCTVLCTIHQPSSECFELFDRLLLLALGKTVYHGKADKALEYYNRLGHFCPSNYNPADHYIKVVSVIPGEEETSKRQIAALQDAFSESSEHKEIVKAVEAAKDNVEEQTAMLTILSDPKRQGRYKVGFFVQFYACVVRGFKVTYRNPMITWVKLIQQMIAAIIIGLIYLRPNFLRPYKSHEAMTVVGAIFVAIVNNTFTCAMSVMHTFPEHIPVFRREHFNGMYSTAVFFYSKNIADIPMYVALPLVYTVIAYFLFGLFPSAGAFFVFFAYLVLMCQTAVSFGYMVSTISPNVAVALAIGPAIIMPLLLLGGFFIPEDQVPVFMFWIKYISWFYYTNELMNINQWQYVDYLGCPELFIDDNQTVPASWTDPQQDPCLYKDGMSVLTSMDFSEHNIGRDIGLSFVLLIGYRAVSLAALYYRARESTR